MRPLGLKYAGGRAKPTPAKHRLAPALPEAASAPALQGSARHRPRPLLRSKIRRPRALASRPALLKQQNPNGISLGSRLRLAPRSARLNQQQQQSPKPAVRKPARAAFHPVAGRRSPSAIPLSASFRKPAAIKLAPELEAASAAAAKRIGSPRARSPVPESIPEHLRTPVDRVLEMVEQRGVLPLDDISGELSVDPRLVEEWARILDDHHLAALHYPMIGKPLLMRRELAAKAVRKEQARGLQKQAMGKRVPARAKILYLILILAAILLLYGAGNPGFFAGVRQSLQGIGPGAGFIILVAVIIIVLLVAVARGRKRRGPRHQKQASRAGQEPERPGKQPAGGEEEETEAAVEDALGASIPPIRAGRASGLSWGSLSGIQGLLKETA